MMRRRRLALLSGDDSGSTVLAAVIAFAAVMLILAVVFQAVLWYAARNTALTAAQQGVAAARDRGASIGDGVTAACGFARGGGHGFLLGASCSGSGGTTVTVTVSGRAPSFIPFFNPAVTETATGPAERWSTSGGRP